MSEFISAEEIEQAAGIIQQEISQKPRVGMILGSGLGSLAEEVENAVIIPYGDIPTWPVSTVEGHQGRLVIGSLENQEVLVMQGRAHYYEGYSMTQVGFPVRVMQQLGLEILIVTNAAGAVNPDFKPGDVMLITDHLNFLGMAGESPLRGPNLDQFGPRFPDIGIAYDRELGEFSRQSAEDGGFPLHEGIYVCLAGPSFETPADLRFLQLIGVDAVGMSTVPEVTVARHGGMRTLGLSTISNKANLDGKTTTSHEEVLAAGKIVLPRLIHIIKGVLRRL
ncbi:MAG: purine-nucleoside phosphorylase [Chloroflexota bacterium]|nr:MAG: purine-nucleoside phosphorylase [Chloroflexota bacterium]